MEGCAQSLNLLPEALSSGPNVNLENGPGCGVCISRFCLDVEWRWKELGVHCVVGTSPGVLMGDTGSPLQAQVWSHPWLTGAASEPRDDLWVVLSRTTGTQGLVCPGAASPEATFVLLPPGHQNDRTSSWKPQSPWHWLRLQKFRGK